MNGFTNAILSLLLGWLRSLFNAVWSLLGSDDGGMLINLLRNNWKVIFLILCVGGFIVDRLIYLIRWRPYYVWEARRRRRHAEAEEPESPPYADDYPNAYAPPAYYDEPLQAEPDEPYDLPEQTARYRQPPRTVADPDATVVYPVVPGRNAQPPIAAGAPGYARATAYGSPQGFAPAANNGMAQAAAPAAYRDTTYAPRAATGAAFAPQSAGGATFAPQNEDGARSARPLQPAVPARAPMADPYARPGSRAAVPVRDPRASGFSPESAFAPTASYQAISFAAPPPLEPLADDARFDDDLSCWNSPQNMMDDYAPRQSPDRNLAIGMEPVFGASQPEPPRYQQEASIGQVAAPIYPQRMEPYQNTPVHPGLDLETFQQNIGLTGAETLESPDRRSLPPEQAYPNFSPFPVAERPEPQAEKPRGLGALAKKARTLVSGEDERNPLSIRDLQSTVDVKSAFHAPVYPKKKPESEEE